MFNKRVLIVIIVQVLVTLGAFAVSLSFQELLVSIQAELTEWVQNLVIVSMALGICIDLVFSEEKRWPLFMILPVVAVVLVTPYYIMAQAIEFFVPGFWLQVVNVASLIFASCLTATFTYIGYDLPAVNNPDVKNKQRIAGAMIGFSIFCWLPFSFHS